MRAAWILFLLWVPLTLAHAQAPDADRTAVMVEALSRLSPEQVAANPQLKAAVAKVLDATRGTPQFLKIVEQLQLKDQNAGLLEVAQRNAADEAGVSAIRLVLGREGALVEQALNGADAVAATKTAEALGNAADKRNIGFLLPLVTNSQRDVALRKQCVRALARTQEGAQELVQLARLDKLPADVRFAAATELHAARWPDVKAAAKELFPQPQGANAQALPPVPELLKMSGDAARGEKVFERPEVACSNCHQVNGKGKDFGPALSEIGTKLGKDALYEAILDPSAGISFGFEAHEIRLKSGDDLVGIIVSETADELVVKDATAIATRVKKSDIRQREQLKTSIMPAGLTAAMSTQELVDLVEYLASLKKK
ncbi:MAG: c-type cytochrome [Verrucomicrobiota bacterium]